MSSGAELSTATPLADDPRRGASPRRRSHQARLALRPQPFRDPPEQGDVVVTREAGHLVWMRMPFPHVAETAIRSRRRSEQGNYGSTTASRAPRSRQPGISCRRTRRRRTTARSTPGINGSAVRGRVPARPRPGGRALPRAGRPGVDQGNRPRAAGRERGGGATSRHSGPSSCPAQRLGINRLRSAVIVVPIARRRLGWGRRGDRGGHRTPVHHSHRRRQPRGAAPCPACHVVRHREPQRHRLHLLDPADQEPHLAPVPCLRVDTLDCRRPILVNLLRHLRPHPLPPCPDHRPVRRQPLVPIPARVLWRGRSRRLRGWRTARGRCPVGGRGRAVRDGPGPANHVV